MNFKNIGLIVAFVLVFVCGFVLGRSGIETPINSFTDKALNTIEQSAGDGTNTNTAGDSGVSSDTQIKNNNSEAPISSGQRKMLESFGINPDEATLTPEMIACAEAKIGKARVAEIMGGAIPSIMEGASLVACYK